MKAQFRPGRLERSHGRPDRSVSADPLPPNSSQRTLDSSDEVIKSLLNDRIGSVEKELSADVVTYRGPIGLEIDDLIREAVEELTGRRNRVAMILQTDGGYIEVAERIARVLRHHYQQVEFVIPNYAMSAGTVLVMSGDNIKMDYYSNLGPIDPQVQRAGSQTWVPALGYLEKYEELVRKSRGGKLSSAELTFLIEKFDPAELFRYEQEKDLSVSLLKEWLTNYKFKDWTVTETRRRKVSLKMKEKRAGEIATALSTPSKWHTHSRGISMQVLRDKLKLKIDDFSANPSLNEAIRSYERLLYDYSVKVRAQIVLHTRSVFASF
jgi:hypothetical protein